MLTKIYQAHRHSPLPLRRQRPLHDENGPFQIKTDSRIMVDAAFLREMNWNYSRLKIDRAGEIRPDPPQECFNMFEGAVTTRVSPHD